MSCQCAIQNETKHCSHKKLSFPINNDVWRHTQCDLTKITYVLIRSLARIRCFTMARMVFSFRICAEFEVGFQHCEFLFYSCFFTASRINLIGFVCVVTTMISNTIQPNQPTVRVTVAIAIIILLVLTAQWKWSFDLGNDIIRPCCAGSNSKNEKKSSPTEIFPSDCV